MNPIHLNLAARPYRDYRPLYAVVVGASLLIAWMMLNNIETYYRYVNDTQITRGQIDRLDAETARERERGEGAKARLRSINVAALDRQTKFINHEIAERAFSWSELLDRLETVLSPNTRIIQITPAFDKSGTQVHLELFCETKTAGGMVEMIQRFNRDPHFSSPFPRIETIMPTGYSFRMGVEYKPSGHGVVRTTGQRIDLASPQGTIIEEPAGTPNKPPAVTGNGARP